jgi:hypothetical protein
MRIVMVALTAALAMTPVATAAQSSQQMEVRAERLSQLVEITIPICRRALSLGPEYRGRQAEWVAAQLASAGVEGEDLLVSLNLCNAYVQGSNDQMNGALRRDR